MVELREELLQKPIVGHYFGLFNWHSKKDYERIVREAPFASCNLLILAFVQAEGQEGEDRTQDGPYAAAFDNGRENDPDGHPVRATEGDTDEARLRLVVETARAKNQGIKILLSLAAGSNSVTKAAQSPQKFAHSMASIVQTYNLDGVDLDCEWESIRGLKTSNLLELAQSLRDHLDRVTPKRQMVMTISADMHAEDLMDKEILEKFTYTLAMTYDHKGAGAGPIVERYYNIFRSYNGLLFGLNSEGYLGGDSHSHPDDPRKLLSWVRDKSAAGLFAWRLDNDSLNSDHFPTFAAARLMGQLMNLPKAV